MAGRQEFSRPVIINVGANIGSSCIPLARRTDKTIVAIEPVPRTFDLLTRNIEQNGLAERVRAVRAAVTETPGVVELMVPGDTGGSEIRASRQGFSPFIPAGAHIDVSTAEGKPLHAFVSRPEDVALVWSDTQGFETAVVRSGASLWAAGAPLWVEVWPDGLEAHGGTAPFLAACQQHFRSFVLDRDFEDRIAATIRPVSELEQVVREITVGERQDRRASTDVLLLP
jgi:FkbM family methyltransferase